MATTSPTALNKLLENRATLNFPITPEVVFNLKTFSLPGLSLGTAMHPTPLIDRKIPGTKLSYDDLSITFFVDEEMKSWNFIHNWMRGLATPYSLKEYREKPAHLETGYINILTSKNNMSFRISIYEMWPVSLSGVNFTYETGDAIPLTADASFSILRYDIQALTIP